MIYKTVTYPKMILNFRLMMNKVWSVIFQKCLKCWVPVNMTNVSTGIHDVDGSDDNGCCTSDREQNSPVHGKKLNTLVIN